jgi:Uma2 family endonuclease
MQKERHAGRRMSLEEYLAFEEKSSIKHEYVSGWVYAMSGGTTRHNLISLNITRHLHSAARRHGCTVFAADVMVRATKDRIYYPDVLIACGRAAEVELIVDEPSLVVEVTSPRSRLTDRREKLDAYLQNISLRTYLVIDQRRRYVVAYTRDAKGEWTREEIQGSGAVAIPFLDLRLKLDAIYEDVKLPPLAIKEGEEWDEGRWADYENAESEAEADAEDQEATEDA